MTSSDETKNNSVGVDDDITLKLKDLYISDTTEKYAECERDIIEKFKGLTISDVEDIDEDLVESLKNVLHISRNEGTEVNMCISNNEFEKCLIIVLLSKCEFPVTWNPVKPPPYDRPQLFMEKVTDKDEETEDTRQFKWVSFVLQLILVHELMNENKFSEAYAKVRELQTILYTLQQENCKESLYLTYHDALHHIVASTEAYILLKRNLLLKAKQNHTHLYDRAPGKYKEFHEQIMYKMLTYLSNGCPIVQTYCNEHIFLSKCLIKLQVLKNIVPVNKMTKTQRSGILGLKAQMFMEYGFQSTKKCIEIIKEAIQLDEFQAEWHFILGKAIGRIRRFNCYKSVDREEISALEMALKLNNNACYLVHLAQTYREHEYIVYLQSRDVKNTSVFTEEIYKLIIASKKLIRKALELSPNCPHINIRCALGLLKIPHLYRTNNLTDTVKKCIDVAIEKAPNNRMLHHVIGAYYTKVEMDIEKAEKHLKIAARQNTYGASIDLIKLKYRQNKEFDILKSLEAVLEQYTELERKCQTLAQIGSYYLFGRKDLVTAVEYYLKIINEYPQCETMKMHKVLFLRMSFPVNLYSVVSAEINLWFSKNNDKTAAKILKNFVVKASVIDQNAIKESEYCKSSLVEEIIKESEKADDIVKTADMHKNLTRKDVEKYITKNKYKKYTSKHRKQTNTDENEKNKTKGNKTNKKFTNKRPTNNMKEHKGLKRSHSVDSVYHRNTSVPKFIWDICKTYNKADGSKSENHEIPKTIGNPKKKHNHNDTKQSNEVSENKYYCTGNTKPHKWRRNSDSFINRNNESSCYNDGERNYKGTHVDTQDSKKNVVRSVSMDRQINSESFLNKNFDKRRFGSTSLLEQDGSYRTDRQIKAGTFFNNRFDKRHFGSASNVEQGGRFRKRLDSASSGDSEFSYGAISAYKLKCHERSNSCDESLMPCSVSSQDNRSKDSNVGHSNLECDLMSQLSSSSRGFSQDAMQWSASCQGNKSRDSSVGRSNLEHDLMSQLSSSSRGFSPDIRGRDMKGRGRGRGRGRGSVDKSGWMATWHSESVESLCAKIKNSNSFLPDFMQNK